MPTKVAADFLEKAERSGLIAGDRLSQLVAELEGRGVDNPQAIADALVANDTLTRWQADNLLQGKHKGFFLGAYRLLRPLGRGGMGTVYLAQHEMMRRLCAVKVLPQTKLQEGSSILERFYVEAQAVAALDHQNIVRAYDVNKESKDNKVIHYLVMEYIEGQDVQAMVQESGPVDFIKAADYLRQTANGLVHAHECGLVHRDIKPANLLVDKKGVVKILDLGLARFYDDTTQGSLTTAHNETVMGTADYLSPEQALNSHNVDHRTDIYSLGCTGYFMLTGHPPFPEGSVAQRLVAHQVKTPAPITQDRRDAPRDLVAIIDKMMAKDPQARYANATEISTALAAWLLEHGGEDWRRQHTEITGDSGLLSMLKQREPTRAMSAPFSETELELAPLDEEAEQTSASSSRITLAPTRGRGPSDSKTRAVSAQSDLGLAQLPADAPPAASPAGAGKTPRPSKTREPSAAPAARTQAKAATQPGSPIELERLADLGSFGNADLLGSLNAADLATSAPVRPSGAGPADDWLQSPLAGRTLAAPARRPVPEPPKGPLASLKSVGLPILIGGGGGLLLVGIVILVWILRGADEPPKAPTQVTLNQPVSQPPPVTTPPTGPSQKPQQPPASTPVEDKKTETKQPPPEPGKPNAQPAVTPATGDKPSTTARPTVEPQPKEKTQPSPGPEKTPSTQPPTPTPQPPKSEPGKGPDSKPQPAAVDLTPERKAQLLAKLDQVEVKLQADEKIAVQVRLMVENKMEEAVKNVGAKVGSGPTKMIGKLDLKPEGGLMTAHLAVSLEHSEGGGSPVVLWSSDEEIGRFTAASKASTVLEVMRNKVGLFFSSLRKAVNDARKQAGT